MYLQVFKSIYNSNKRCKHNIILLKVPMNTIEILECLKTIAKKSYTYGVYPSDKLPSAVKKPSIIVCNIDPSYKPGSHWIAIYISKNNEIEYFDSYGMSPKNIYIKSFLNKLSKKFIYNNYRLQSDFSTLCGNYCCVYLYFKTKNKSLQDFLKYFTKHKYLHLNDKKILKQFNSIFKSKKIKQIGGRFCNQTCVPRLYKRKNITN